PELHLVDAGPFDASGETEEPRPRRVGSARGGECCTSIGHDPEDVDQRLDVVDNGRLAEQAALDGKRRLVARLSAIALDRIEQRGLLTADVRARTPPH